MDLPYDFEWLPLRLRFTEGNKQNGHAGAFLQTVEKGLNYFRQCVSCTSRVDH